MVSEAVHTLILGAGPAGLAAGDRLTRAGVSPVVILEKQPVAGGLMRSIQHGQFILDIGRKELYRRIPAVDALWTELLGDDYRPYPHRFGSLHRTHIIESSPAYRGFRRGMPWGMFFGCLLDLGWCWIAPPLRRPRNYEQYMYRTAGRRFSRIMAQDFWEKFNAMKWAEMPVPADHTSGRRAGLRGIFKSAAARAFGDPSPKPGWRHPARGTGQICEVLERRIREAGGRFEFGARVARMVTSHERVSEVVTETSDGAVTWTPRHVVAGLPLGFLARLLLGHDSREDDPNQGAPGVPLRSTILVYLFLDEAPRFPHAWLEVTTPGMRAGRITNYAAFNGDMVPKGQTCLCVEFFCGGADPLLELSTVALRDLALEECARSLLIDPARCFDHLVLRLPGADAAVSLKNWQSDLRSRLLAQLRRFINLYYVNQPGTDHATFAGLEAAEAIFSGDRTLFDKRTDLDLMTVGSV